MMDDNELDKFVAFHTTEPKFYKIFCKFVERWSANGKTKIYAGSAFNSAAEVLGLTVDPAWAECCAALYVEETGVDPFQRGLFSTQDPYNVKPQHVNPHVNPRLAAIKWRKDHPEGYALFVQYANMLKEKGMKKFGINLLRERVRWEGIYVYNTRYKFTNGISPYIGRMLIIDDPELAGIIECRETRF